MIYFLIMNMIMTAPVLCLNNQTFTKITPIQVIDTITINHSFTIPLIIKIWFFQQFLLLI